MSSPIIFEANEDELKKKRIRQMQNRQSAAQYRERKKEYLDKLESVVEQLESERNQLISNTEKLAASQNEVNLKISKLEEKLDLSIQKNRELKSTLAQLAKTTGAPVESELLQDQMYLDQPSQQHQQHVKYSANHYHTHGHSHSNHQHQNKLLSPQQQSNINSFNLEGNRSILNNESPSSSTSSSPIHNTHLTLSDSNEKYIDKFSSITISSLSSSGERDHLGGSGSNSNSLENSNEFKSHPLNSFKIESPSTLKYQQQKRSRDMLPELLNAASQSSGSSNSNNLNNSNNSNNSSSNNSIQSPSIYTTSPSPSPSLSFSPLNKLPSLSPSSQPNNNPSILSTSINNNNNSFNNQSFTPPLASFSSILSIASPSSSPLISSLSSSPSSCYLGSSISSDTYSQSSNTTNSSSGTFNRNNINDSYSNSPSNSRYKSYLK